MHLSNDDMIKWVDNAACQALDAQGDEGPLMFEVHMDTRTAYNWLHSFHCTSDQGVSQICGIRIRRHDMLMPDVPTPFESAETPGLDEMVPIPFCLYLEVKKPNGRRSYIDHPETSAEYK